jgi:hypothetical protein
LRRLRGVEGGEQALPGGLVGHRGVGVAALRLVPLGPAHALMQPSANPTTTRPSVVTLASMKSSRLRPLPQVVPSAHIQPRCTGSAVALTVVQVAPAS